MQLWFELFFVEAIRSLARNKVRTSLAALGIAVGIGAVVLVIAVGQAGTERAQAALEALGDNLISDDRSP